MDCSKGTPHTTHHLHIDGGALEFSAVCWWLSAVPARRPAFLFLQVLRIPTLQGPSVLSPAWPVHGFGLLLLCLHTLPTRAYSRRRIVLVPFLSCSEQHTANQSFIFVAVWRIASAWRMGITDVHISRWCSELS